MMVYNSAQKFLLALLAENWHHLVT